MDPLPTALHALRRVRFVLVALLLPACGDTEPSLSARPMTDAGAPMSDTSAPQDGSAPEDPLSDARFTPTSDEVCDAYEQCGLDRATCYSLVTTNRQDAITSNCIAELNANQACVVAASDCSAAEECAAADNAFNQCYRDYLYRDVDGDLLSDDRFTATGDDICGNPDNYCSGDRATCEANLQSVRQSAIVFDCVGETNALYDCVLAGIDCNDLGATCPEERRALAGCIAGTNP